MNKIVAVAIRVGKMIVTIPAPARHHHVLHALWNINRNLLIKPSDQGFIDQNGKYLTRQEAWVVAKAVNQIVRVNGVEGTLYSEDLW